MEGRYVLFVSDRNCVSSLKERVIMRKIMLPTLFVVLFCGFAGLRAMETSSNQSLSRSWEGGKNVSGGNVAVLRMLLNRIDTAFTVEEEDLGRKKRYLKEECERIAVMDAICGKHFLSSYEVQNLICKYDLIIVNEYEEREVYNGILSGVLLRDRQGCELFLPAEYKKD